MRVRFLSHASIEVHCGGRRIVSDPWFDGKVFNDAWALITPPIDARELLGVDYVWISHEHPDHFHLPTLRSIPPDQRSAVTLLYQAHASPRIATAVRRLGFTNLIELPLYRWHRLEDGIELYCGSVGTMDSFLAIRSEGECILNLNDCVLNVKQLEYIKRQVGRISILFSQFSFANWVGNEVDELGAAEHKSRQLAMQIEVLQPRWTVPFASFSYFCNQENSRMNAWANTPRSLADLGLDTVRFMYPGDTWDAREDSIDSERAVERYSEVYASRRLIDPTPPPVAVERLAQAVEERLQTTGRGAWKLLLRSCPEFDIFVKDLGKILVVDPPRQRFSLLEPTAERAQHARYVMCSQVAWYTFAFPWGAATTQVGGMFLDRAFREQGPNRFFRLQNAVATEILRGGDRDQLRRTLRFWWAKRQEVRYRMIPGFPLGGRNSA